MSHGHPAAGRVQLNVRATEAERDELRAAAERREMSITEYVLDAALERARHPDPGSRVRWAVKDMRASLDKVGNLADELQQKLDAVSDAVAIPEPEEF